MRNILIIVSVIPLLLSCRQKVDIEKAKNEILQTEKEFEKMASEKSLADAFYFFASEDAVIRRGNDSLIFGKENIKHFYNLNANPKAKLSWTPDFVGVSDCGTLGYTYGKYVYSIQDTSGKTTEHTGIFHTVWIKQNNNWRFVWD